MERTSNRSCRSVPAANTLKRLGTVTTKVRRAASHPPLRATFSSQEKEQHHTSLTYRE
jgi:hypothetical protein